MSGGLLSQAWSCPQPGYLYNERVSGFEAHVAEGNENTAGVDYHMRLGAPLVAVASGVSGYRTDGLSTDPGGNTVSIFHGTIVIEYSHLKSIANLQLHKQVARGDVIGFEGKSGDQPVSHLHMSVYANAIMARNARFKLHRYGPIRHRASGFERYGWGEYYVSPDSLTARPSYGPLFERPFDPRADRDIEAPLDEAVEELRDLGRWYFESFDVSRSSGDFFPIFWDWFNVDFPLCRVINLAYYTWQRELEAGQLTSHDRTFMDQFFEKVEAANEALQLTGPYIAKDPEIIGLLAEQNPDHVQEILDPQFNGCFLLADGTYGVQEVGFERAIRKD